MQRSCSRGLPVIRVNVALFARMWRFAAVQFIDYVPDILPQAIGQFCIKKDTLIDEQPDNKLVRLLKLGLQVPWNN
jgi:hypothetical protein